LIEATAEEIRRLAVKALAGLPERFRTRLENVSIVVDRKPRRRDLRSLSASGGGLLLGLYRGVPRSVRGPNYSLVSPDEIVLFEIPIRRAARTREELAGVVRTVLLHEIGHHFGIDDSELRRLGY
jgi:predicted Zn-dependent protease with MMP-like domain